MIDFAIKISEMFIAFFLANIASRYAKDYIDKKLKVGKIKDEHDIKLASEIIDLIDKETLDFLRNITTSGNLPRDLNDDIVEVKRLGEYKKFYDEVTQNYFEVFHEKLVDLKVFCAMQFSPRKGDSSSFEIHKYHLAPNGQEMYEENIEKLNSLLNDFENSFYNFEEVLRDKYPSVFLDNNK